jgi:pyridoxal/pyridoxine/pyridoxamine kinase
MTDELKPNKTEVHILTEEDKQDGQAAVLQHLKEHMHPDSAMFVAAFQDKEEGVKVYVYGPHDMLHFAAHAILGSIKNYMESTPASGSNEDLQ